jgi:hypothetical protein
MDPELAYITPDKLIVWKCPGLKIHGHGEDDKELPLP